MGQYAHLQHMRGVLWCTAVAGEGILLGVDSPPFVYVELMRSFDLPVLDEVLNHQLE